MGDLFVVPEPQFHVYDLVVPTANVESLLAEIDSDPTAIFRGRG